MFYLTIFAILSLSLCEEFTSKLFINLINYKDEKEGVSTNNSKETIEAVSYGLAKALKTDDFYVNNSKDYKPPTYVDKLPPKTPIGGGDAVTIDEVKIQKIKNKNK